MSPKRTASEYLASRVDELEGLWLELVCASCGSKGSYPFKMMRARLGAKRVDETIPRFKCHLCGGSPGRVAVVSYPAHGTPQYPDAWAVTLVGDEPG